MIGPIASAGATEQSIAPATSEIAPPGSSPVPGLPASVAGGGLDDGLLPQPSNGATPPGLSVPTKAPIAPAPPPEPAPVSGHRSDHSELDGRSDVRPIVPAGAAPVADAAPGSDRPAGSCTAAQLRRFVKSRAYVPLHELRRRFELNGVEDDVSAMDVQGRRLFVGLPPREAGLLAELLGAGDIGYELLLDPTSPLVVGVYPMRPVPRA